QVAPDQFSLPRFSRSSLLGMSGSGPLTRVDQESRNLNKHATKSCLHGKNVRIAQNCEQVRVEGQNDSPVHPGSQGPKKLQPLQSSSGRSTRLAVFFTSLLVLRPRPLSGRCRYPNW